MSEKDFARISLPVSQWGPFTSLSPTVLITTIFYREHLFFLLKKQSIRNDACDKYASFKPFRNIKGFPAQCLTDLINPFLTDTQEDSCGWVLKLQECSRTKGKKRERAFKRERDPRATQNRQRIRRLGGFTVRGELGAGVGLRGRTAL